MLLSWLAACALLVAQAAPPDPAATGPASSPTVTRRAACGYVATRLLLPPDILPSCLAVRGDGTLAVGSMDGDRLLALDTDRDGNPDRYRRWAGTLPHWPLGLLAEGNDLVLATRSALLRLSDQNGDGWAERWQTLAKGVGLTPQ